MQAPDLRSIEDVLVALAVESIRAFAQEHQEESFYAFGFDCNAEYGKVLLCFNTEADFKKSAAHYVAKWKYNAEKLEDLKKNFGDWQYQGFNLEQPQWDAAWASHKQAIEEYVFSDTAPKEERKAFVEELMRRFCQALIRVERSGALDMLAKDPGFYTQVVDHDEGINEAADRLREVRHTVITESK